MLITQLYYSINEEDYVVVSPMHSQSKESKELFSEEKKYIKQPITFTEQSQFINKFGDIRIHDSYIGESSVRKPRRSISESRLEDDYEEITDTDYVYTNDEWSQILENAK